MYARIGTIVIVVGLLSCTSVQEDQSVYSEEVFFLTMPDDIQIDCTLFLPATPPPSDGFPVIIPIHGGGGNKGHVTNEWRDLLINENYAVFCYTTRGCDASGGDQDDLELTRRRADLIYIVDWLREECRRRGTMDPDNIAIIGRSGGGLHGWIAAGFQLPVKTVVVGNTCPTSLVYNNCLIRFWAQLYANPNTHRRFGDFIQPLSRLYQSGDVAALASQPHRTYIRNNLKKITIPVYYQTAWLDQAYLSHWGLDAFSELTTVKKLYIGTGGHGSQSVREVWDWRREQTIRWLDYWLKGIDTGIMDEPVVSYAEDTDWSVRYSDTFPPQNTRYKNWFIAPDLALSESPPHQHAEYTIHQERIIPDYDLEDYLTRDSDTPVSEAIRHQSILLTSSPFTEETEWSGAPEVTLSSSSAHTGYQTHIHFYDIGPDGTKQFITQANYAVLDNDSDALQQRTFRGLPISHIFQPGHVLAAEITTLDDREHKRAFVLPYFTSYDVQVLSSAASPGTLSLPIVSPKKE